jgi:transcriptional regulator
MVNELTKKEKEVLKLRYSSLKNKEIALKLGVSEADVSQTLARATAKVTNVSETLGLMKEIGFIKDDVEIELTEKGNELFGKWITEWNKDFKQSKCIVHKQEHIPQELKKRKDATNTESSPDLQEMNRKIDTMLDVFNSFREQLGDTKRFERPTLNNQPKNTHGYEV